MKGNFVMKLMRFQRPELWNWSAFDQISNLRDEINRIFESPSGPGNGSEVFNTWAPAVDLYEDHDNLIVKAELPGFKKEDLDISLHEGNLTISGERKQEQSYDEAAASRSERFFGRFQRTVSLPKTVQASAIKANYKDGILTVTLPKTEEAKPKQIQVQVN